MKAVTILRTLGFVGSLCSVHAGLVERIVGGSSVSENKYPFAVRLTITTGSDNLLCGGTLIDNDLVVTAGHCMVDSTYNNVFEPNEVTVCYGASSITKQSCTTARNITVHPDYDPMTLQNDIALIKITALKLSSSVNTVPIFTGALDEGTKLTTMGWGKTQSNSSSSLPTTLMSVEIEVGDAKTCQQAQPSYKSAAGPEVCSVNALTPGKDSCQGDSGSPAVVESNGQVYIAALTSSGVDLADPGAVDCATKDGLAFYTHVYYFADFISQVSGKSANEFTSSHDSSDDSSESSGAERPLLSSVVLLSMLALVAL
ncbi:hypothetical protein IWW46_001123 [Coemansia sp. RSA 2440]|nr:hypothetical protein IWW46_001123 [Coemansia sp. RSA 2440]KAJ2555475.1 hypothetical protein IWW35_000671 [Coemansia sp. RSA 1878]